MNKYTISFFGGGKVRNTFAAESEIEEKLVNILSAKENLRFIVTPENEFSSIADYVLHRLKKALGVIAKLSFCSRIKSCAHSFLMTAIVKLNTFPPAVKSLPPERGTNIS